MMLGVLNQSQAISLTTKLLLDFEAAINSQTFIDSSGRGHTITKGTTDSSVLKISNDHGGYAGNSSGFFWISNAWIETEASPDFAVGTGDFDIDLAAYSQFDAQTVSLIRVGSLEVILISGASGGIRILPNNFIAACNIPINSWGRIQLQRTSGNLAIKFNGSTIYSAANTTDYTGTSKVRVGNVSYPGNIYIDAVTVKTMI